MYARIIVYTTFDAQFLLLQLLLQKHLVESTVTT